MTQQEYENKIKELQDELEKLKAVKRWKPENGDIFYAVCVDGDVGIFEYNNEDFHEGMYLIGNCFKTSEEAEEYKKQIEYTARYKNYVEEHSEPIDFENDKQCKYLVEFSYNGHIIQVSEYYALKKQGAIYASSPEIIRNAIKEIGEDNFKKYVLGVK